MPPEKQNHATEEDIALFKKTEDEIRADVSVLSFNVETLKKRIRDEDPAQAIIQAHLHLDHVVSQMLSEAVPFPRHLQLDRTGFNQKLQLVAAMGLLAPNLLAPIKVINSIRNRIAHKLDYSVNSADAAKLRSAVPKWLSHEDDGSSRLVQDILRFFVILIDYQRQEHVFQRRMKRKLIAKINVTLDDVEI